MRRDLPDAFVRLIPRIRHLVFRPDHDVNLVRQDFAHRRALVDHLVVSLDARDARDLRAELNAEGARVRVIRRRRGRALFRVRARSDCRSVLDRRRPDGLSGNFGRRAVDARDERAVATALHARIDRARVVHCARFRLHERGDFRRDAGRDQSETERLPAWHEHQADAARDLPCSGNLRHYSVTPRKRNAAVMRDCHFASIECSDTLRIDCEG